MCFFNGVEPRLLAASRYLIGNQLQLLSFEDGVLWACSGSSLPVQLEQTLINASYMYNQDYSTHLSLTSGCALGQ